MIKPSTLSEAIIAVIQSIPPNRVPATFYSIWQHEIVHPFNWDPLPDRLKIQCAIDDLLKSGVLVPCSLWGYGYRLSTQVNGGENSE